MMSPCETPCEILSVGSGPFGALIAVVFTMPDKALVLAPVAMLVAAGACSDSCTSASAFACAEDPLWTIKTGEAAVWSGAGALTTVISSAADAALAGTEVLAPGPSANTPAEGLDEEGTAVVPTEPCSVCGVTTSSPVAGWVSGAEA